MSEPQTFEALRSHVTHLLYAIDHGYFTDKYLPASAFVEPLRSYAKPLPHLTGSVIPDEATPNG